MIVLKLKRFFLNLLLFNLLLLHFNTFHLYWLIFNRRTLLHFNRCLYHFYWHFFIILNEILIVILLILRNNFPWKWFPFTVHRWRGKFLKSGSFRWRIYLWSLTLHCSKNLVLFLDTLLEFDLWIIDFNNWSWNAFRLLFSCNAFQGRLDLWFTTWFNSIRCFDFGWRTWFVLSL